MSGAIDIIDPHSGQLRCSLQSSKATSSSSSKSAEIIGLHFVPPKEDTTTSNNNTSKKQKKNNSNEAAHLPAVVSVTTGGSICLYTHEPEENNQYCWKETQSWSAPPDVCSTAFDPQSGLLAIGCKGAELRLIDINTGQTAFTAKGGKPNKVGVVDPAWNTALAFVPGSGGKKIIVGTGHHKLRMYDTTVGKRPQLDIPFGETRITALALESDGQRCWVGNGLGQLEVYDFKTGRFSGAIKGIAGSVRSVVLSTDGGIIVSVGLDRFLRLHDTKSRSGLGKVYLKSQLTGAVIVPMLPVPVKSNEGGRQDEGNKNKGSKRAHGGSDNTEAGSSKKHHKAKH